jgi:hypothetical protein
MLGPGEQVLFTATMRRQPGLFWQIVLIGGLLLFLMTKVYFVALTNRRMILIRTKVGFWSFSGTPEHMNLGLEQWDARSIVKVTTSGFANNRSMTFHLSDRSAQTLRVSPWQKAITGTKDFLERVPGFVASGELARLAAGAAYASPSGDFAASQLSPGGQQAYAYQEAAGHSGFDAQPHAAFVAQPPAAFVAQPPAAFVAQPPAAFGVPQQSGYGGPVPAYGAPPPPAQGFGFSPGMQVVVTAQDGSRHYATVVREEQGHYLVNTQSGQHWFPATHVARA